ncbi:MAG TPA: phospholipase D family protein [Abditibacteriaceae bacterium]|jgi:phosphatidylserine/phosphatidylglycerophosphate/cardiolipin synthase-like enzyme
MKKLYLLLLLFALMLPAGIIGGIAGANAGNTEAATETLIEARAAVYFSPKGGAQDAIIRAINGAKTSILLQAYSFTNASIAQALVQAKQRGVLVEAVLDKSNRTAQYSSATFLKNAGIHTSIDAKHAIAHNKVIIIDSDKVVTGSFNFSKAAEESNAENLLILHSKPLAAEYERNFRAHLEHSEDYEGKQ